MNLNEVALPYYQDAEKQRLKDIEDLQKNKETFHMKNIVQNKEKKLYENVLSFFPHQNKKDWEESDIKSIENKLRKEEKIVFNRRKLLNFYREKYTQKPNLFNPSFHDILIGKKLRSHSGVLVITLFTSPYPNGQKFSCQWDCAYCPNEPEQPRSYLLREPGVSRANQEEFDCVRQMHCRLRTLDGQGHPLDKLEIIILGGTWESYPKEYRDEFIRDVYFGANTYYEKRDALSLQEEQNINETASLKIIGLTIETRPDTIAPKVCKELRYYGVTRVQLGVQTNDDEVLKIIDRRCTTKHTKKAIATLMAFGFKVDIHLMPNLPGSSPEKDRKMLNDFISEPELIVDQMKIYPTEITPWTKIQKWYEDGKYNPYSDKELEKVLIEFKTNVPEFIRLNRVVRDIPPEYVIAGFNNMSMRDILHKKMREQGLECKCIRCREVRLREIKPDNVVFSIMPVSCVNGNYEYFLQYESKVKKHIYALCRLRICHNPDYTVARHFPFFSNFKKYAFIRELHVYGKIKRVGEKTFGAKAQHIGFGKKLIKEAENLCLEHDVKNLFVISGNSVREYYRTNGFQKISFEDGGDYMYKKIKEYPKISDYCTKVIIIALCIFMFFTVLMSFSQ